MQIHHRIVISTFFLLYAATFLPYFGFFNQLNFIGPFPEPMAWVLFINVINTGIVFLVYFNYFKPFCANCDKEFQNES